MTDLDKKILNDLGRTDFGRALKVYLEEKKEEIGDITTAQSWEDTKGKQIALKVIKELFSFMAEKKDERIKNQYV